MLAAGILIFRRRAWVIGSRKIIRSVWIVIRRWTPPRTVSKPVGVRSPEWAEPKTKPETKANSITISGVAPIAAVAAIKTTVVSGVEAAMIDGAVKAPARVEAALRKANLRGCSQGQRNGGKGDSSY